MRPPAKPGSAFWTGMSAVANGPRAAWTDARVGAGPRSYGLAAARAGTAVAMPAATRAAAAVSEARRVAERGVKGRTTSYSGRGERAHGAAGRRGARARQGCGRLKCAVS